MTNSATETTGATVTPAAPKLVPTPTDLRNMNPAPPVLVQVEQLRAVNSVPDPAAATDAPIAAPISTTLVVPHAATA
jgi:hypothetical protein